MSFVEQAFDKFDEEYGGQPEEQPCAREGPVGSNFGEAFGKRVQEVCALHFRPWGTSSCWFCWAGGTAEPC